MMLKLEKNKKIGIKKATLQETKFSKSPNCRRRCAAAAHRSKEISAALVDAARRFDSSVMFYGSARTFTDFNSIIREVQPRSGSGGGARGEAQLPPAQILLHHHHR